MIFWKKYHINHYGTPWNKSINKNPMEISRNPTVLAWLSPSIPIHPRTRFFAPTEAPGRTPGTPRGDDPAAPAPLVSPRCWPPGRNGMDSSKNGDLVLTILKNMSSSMGNIIPFSSLMLILYIYTIGGAMCPSWKMMEWTSIHPIDEMDKKKIHVPNHQPYIYMYITYGGPMRDTSDRNWSCSTIGDSW